MTDFLIPFKTASDQLEGDISLTLHKVLVLEKHINKYCKFDIFNSKTCKFNLKKCFVKKYMKYKTSKISCFLWPQFKKLKMVNYEIKRKKMAN